MTTTEEYETIIPMSNDPYTLDGVTLEGLNAELAERYGDDSPEDEDKDGTEETADRSNT